jgi:hypothetical protein
VGGVAAAARRPRPCRRFGRAARLQIRRGRRHPGAEYRFAGPWLVGGSLGYSHVSARQNVTNDRGSIDSLQFGLYGGYRDERLHVLAAALFAQNWLASERFVALAPTTAKAGYTGHSFAIGVEAGRKYAIARVVFQPIASLVYTRVHTHSFAESGTTLLEISGKSQSTNSLKLSLAFASGAISTSAGACSRRKSVSAGCRICSTSAGLSPAPSSAIRGKRRSRSTARSPHPPRRSSASV